MGRSRSLFKNVCGSMSRKYSRRAVKSVYDYLWKWEIKRGLKPRFFSDFRILITLDRSFVQG